MSDAHLEPRYTERVGLASIWKDGLRSRDCWCAEWRPYNYPLFYGPSTGPPCDAPSLFSRGVPIKKTIGAFLGGPRVGSYSSPVPIHRVYNTLTGRSRSVRFLSSSLSLFTSPLPFLPLSFALHARRHNKSFRGTARPETDFVRSVRPRHPRETIAEETSNRRCSRPVVNLSNVCSTNLTATPRAGSRKDPWLVRW